MGKSYTTEIACRNFTHYIAECIKQTLYNRLGTANFFSLLLDGSTDSENVENELFLVIWFDQDGTGEKVCTRASYFDVCRPTSTTAVGMLEVVENALKNFEIQEFNAEGCSKLVGFGTDGASANIAHAGLKGLIEKRVTMDLLDVVSSPQIGTGCKGCPQDHPI